jgi:hypothetical protein
MSPLLPYSRLCALAALTICSAHAQVAMAPLAPASAAKPSESMAVQPPSFPFAYRSAFDGYQPFTESKPKAWKEVNATVETLGGWRTYSQEAPEPMADNATAPAAPSTPASPRPDPHAAHHMDAKK